MRSVFQSSWTAEAKTEVKMSDYSGQELSNEVTPRELYLNRRKLLKAAGTVATVAGSALVYRFFNPVRQMELSTSSLGTLSDVLTRSSEKLLALWSMNH